MGTVSEKRGEAGELTRARFEFLAEFLLHRDTLETSKAGLEIAAFARRADDALERIQVAAKERYPAEDWGVVYRIARSARLRP